MMRYFAAVTCAALALGSSTNSALADSDILCPISQAQRVITDTLPAGWWTTPIVNRLTETRVQEVGGAPVLVCVYGSSGTIQRNAPDGEACTAVTGGFACVSERSAGPQPYATGPMQISEASEFDLDRGQIGATSADFLFQAETADLLYLVPRNGALVSAGDGSNRDYDGCMAANMSESRLSLLDIPPGSHVCFKTNEGRIGQFRVNGVSRNPPKTLSIGYTTWQ